MRKSSKEAARMTVGIDLGDRHSHYYVIEERGGKQVTRRGRMSTMMEHFQLEFGKLPPARMILEAGTHSGWVARVLQSMGHEVVIANPRQVHLISASGKKRDGLDCELLARLGCADPKLLAPIQLREEQLMIDLELVKSRQQLVAARTSLINHTRGVLKASGVRPPKCDARYFHERVKACIPAKLLPGLKGIVETISELASQIKAYDKQIVDLCETRYPQTRLLQQVVGVGPITSLAYALVIGDPKRFANSRLVGSYVGLTPKLDQSGRSNPELRITKAGNPLLRRLLILAAHYILGPFGADCDLRRFGEAHMLRGKKNAKKRAVVAVARKLAVLLHRLWLTGEVYDPDRKETMSKRELARKKTA